MVATIVYRHNFIPVIHLAYSSFNNSGDSPVDKYCISLLLSTHRQCTAMLPTRGQQISLNRLGLFRMLAGVDLYGFEQALPVQIVIVLEYRN